MPVERADAEERLRELMSAQLPRTLRSAGIGLWGWDMASGTIIWSIPARGAEDPRELKFADPEQFAELAHRDDRPGLTDALTAVVTSGADVHQAFRYIRADESIGRTRIDGVCVGEPRHPIAVVGVTRDDSDQLLADELLARSFEARDRVAHVLETSLLPPALPTIPGFVVDGEYRSCQGASTGDFFDLFALGGDDWGLTIGDVGGHGAEAAAITTAVRYTLRAVALVRRSPSPVMAAANEAHFEAVHDERFTTAHFLRINRTDRGVQLRVASAGHPEILVRRRNARVQWVSGEGPMLGLIRSASFVEARVNLDPGDLVVAYTDGVVEARRGSALYGPERLAAFVASWSGPSTGLAAALHDESTAFSGGPIQDDMATVALQLEP